MRQARRSRLRSLLLVLAIVAANFLIGQGPASAASCEPPTPERPGDAVINSIDAAALDHGTPAESNYGNYSYAGTVWHGWKDGDVLLSDQCSGVWDSMDTNLGNWLFKAGKLPVAANNALWYMMGSQSSPVGGMDGAVNHAASVMYGSAFVPYVVLAMLLGGVGMLWHAKRGNTSSVAGRLMSALVGLAIAGLTLSGVGSLRMLDDVVTSGAQSLQGSAAKAALGGPKESQINERDAVPELLYQRVIWRSWLAGEFGNAESSAAKKYGQKLLESQAWKKTDVADANSENKLKNKQNSYRDIAGKLKKEDPGAYEVFTGGAETRIGTGFFSAIRGLLYGVFPTLAQMGALLVLWVLRLLFVGGSVIGLLLLVTERAIGPFFRGIGKALGHGALLEVGAACYYLAASIVSQQTSNSAVELVLLSITTVVAFAIFHPIRNLYKIVGGLTEAAGFENRGKKISQFGVMRSYKRWRRERRYDRRADSQNEMMSELTNAIRGMGNGMAMPQAPSHRAEEADAAHEPISAHAERARQHPSAQGTAALAGAAMGSGFDTGRNNPGAGSAGAPGGGPGNSPGGQGSGGGGTTFASATRMDQETPYSRDGIGNSNGFRYVSGTGADDDTGQGIAGERDVKRGIGGATEPSTGSEPQSRTERPEDVLDDLHASGDWFLPGRDGDDQDIREVRPQRDGDDIVYPITDSGVESISRSPHRPESSDEHSSLSADDEKTFWDIDTPSEGQERAERRGTDADGSDE